ncbi:TRAP transporter large permease [Paracoccus sediminilitoris]|uniref:TRAP transporter large permease n=1 Tax=Paracoccus sediminilitoris TaxID=2202419 RepID=UPI000DB9CB7E|nr:TRAP transporter large permease subunit [Paracoccus sediminilitoris]
MSQDNILANTDRRRPWLSAYMTCRNALEVLLIAAVMMMVVLIGYQVASRYLLNAPSVLTEVLLRYLFIWVGLLGAGLCFIDDRHLNLPIVLDTLSERKAARVRVIIALLTLAFGIGLTWAGYLFISRNLVMRVPILDIPVGYLQSVLLICGFLITLSQIVWLASGLVSSRLVAADLAIAVGTMAVAVGAGWLLTQSAIWQQFVSDAPQLVAVLVLFGTFAVFLILGVPIAVALALSGILTLALQISLTRLAPTIGGRLFSGLDNFGFLALPFFVLAGNIMNQSGIARRLVDFAMLVGRRIPGNLWQTNVISNVFFGCLSGSGIATATAVGGIIAPIAREKNYDPAISTAINAASAPAGMLIPPSGPVIIYSLITGGSASIVALFLAGYLPGLIMAVAVMIAAYFYAKKLGYSAERSRIGTAEAARLFFRAIPSLLLVIAVIAGITGGVFTAVEGSGIAVIYSLVLALCYRSISWNQFVQASRDTVVTTGIIAFLIACSGLMSWSMTFAGIPATIGSMLTAISDNRLVVLLIINVTLLIIGVFMDMTPALLIFTPIFYPIVTELGVDPVHFGMILIYNLCMGVVTPPVGTVLFVACGVSGEPLSRVIRPLLPIFALQILGLLLVTYIPALSLFLPRLFGV